MCCLFGLIDYDNCLSTRRKEKIIRILSEECEARGTDATGIAYMSGRQMAIHKAPLPAHKMHFRFRTNPSVIMGHTRMTTQGSELYNENNHPFYSNKLGFALAHNGVLYNDINLRKAYKLPETKIQTDSYIAVQLIDSKNTLDFNSVKYMAETVEGSFCFTVLSKENELYIVKGDNPMAIARFDGFYIYASTVDILNKALRRLNLKHYEKVEINEGEILKFDRKGNISKANFRFDYGYCCWHTLRNRVSKPINNNLKIRDEYLDNLLYYASSMGVDEDEIMAMVEMGYSLMDIEDMLYETEYLCYEEDDYAEL